MVSTPRHGASAKKFASLAKTLTLPVLPTVNAALNASSAALLFAGWRFVLAGDRATHKKCMVGALSCSALFLITYLYYHYQVGSVRFQGTGAIRTVYLGILLTHTILAVVMLPFIGRAIWLAAHERFEEHARAARWAFPIWFYVSVTGVVIYSMLYLGPWRS